MKHKTNSQNGEEM